jgi:hypothetical protein
MGIKAIVSASGKAQARFLLVNLCTIALEIPQLNSSYSEQVILDLLICK